MSHNGGKSQVDLDFLQGGGEYPFLNLLKTSEFWGWHDGTSTVAITPDLLDSDGYLKVLVHGGVDSGHIFFPSLSVRPGNYVLKWDGTGTVTCSGSVVSSGANRIVYDVTGNNFLVVSVTALASSSDYPHNIRLCHASDETALDAGQVFGVKFKQRLQQANFGVIRFFNWQDAINNGNNCTTWDTANRPTTYFQYQSGQARLDFLGNAAGSGLTTNSAGSDYTISASSAWTGLNDKAIVHVVWNISSPTSSAVTKGSGNNVTWPSHGLVAGNQVYFTDGTATGITISNLSYPFTNPYIVASVTDANNIILTGVTLTAISATGRCIPRLNVGGTSLKPILDNGAAPLTNGGNTFLTGGSSNSFTTLMYDAAMGAWMNKGFLNSPGYLANGVPYSLMIQLCSEVGAHPWFNAPLYACTPITNFWSSLATLVQSTASWMVPRFEGPNECWGSNIDTGYPNAVATSYGWGADFDNWYGKAMSLIGQAINGVYGGTPGTQTAYQVICGVQTATYKIATGADTRLTAALYVSTQSGSAASNWVTHVCGANYYFPSIYGRNAELVLAYAYYVTNAGNPTAQAANAATYEAASNDGFACTFTDGSPGTVNATAHGLALGQILAIVIDGAAAPTGLSLGNLWVNTIPNANTFTVSDQDPNNGVANPLNFSSSAGKTGVCIPNNGFTIPEVVVFFKNIKAWATGINANIKVTCYEGGYSPDYTNAAVVGRVTAASKAANAVFTIPTTTMQDVHGPDQENATNSPFVVGMYLQLQSLTGSGWTGVNGTQVQITNVSGSSITTNLNSSGFAAAFSGTAQAYPCDVTGTVQAPIWLNALRFAAKSAPNMQTSLTGLYNNLTAISGLTFPSMFQLGGSLTSYSGTMPSSNVWSVLEDIYQTPDPPQWLAAIAFNAGGSGPAGPTNTFAFSVIIQGTARITTKMVGC